MKKNVKSGISFGIVLFLVLSVTIIFIVSCVLNYDGGTSKYFDKSKVIVDNELKEILETQEKADKELNKVVENIKEYTLQNPYIKNDPYGINPLSAMVIFSTEELVEVDVYINGGYMSTIEASNNHIIPVYGLLNNTNNIVKFELSNGESEEFSIRTNLYNDYTEEYNLTESMNGSQFTFLVGDRNSVESKLRGFNHDGVLAYYYDLDYITGASLRTDSFYVGYNSKYNKNNKLPALKLQLDYMGKILAITTDTSDLEATSNVNLANIDYVAINQNVYQDNISNYKFDGVIDNNPTTETGIVSVDELALMLETAKEYTNPYTININGNYLSYDFKGNNDIMLLAIDRKGNVYNYPIDETNYVKLPNSKEFSLYVKVGTSYYDLKTIVEV